MNKIFFTLLLILLAVNISFAQRKTFTIDDRWVGKINSVYANDNDVYIIVEDISYFMGYRYLNHFLIKNNHILGKYDYINDFTFYPNSNDYIYIFQKDKNYYVVNNIDTLGPFEDAFDIQFTPDGSRFAFHAKKNEKECIIFNGDTSRFYDEIYDCIFSNDSRNIAIIGENIIEQSAEITDGSHDISESSEREQFLELKDTIIGPYATITDVQYNPVNNHLMYEIYVKDQEENSYLVNDKQTIGPLQLTDFIIDKENGDITYGFIDDEIGYILRNNDTIRSNPETSYKILSGEHKFIGQKSNEGRISIFTAIDKFGPFYSAYIKKSKSMKTFYIIAEEDSGKFLYFNNKKYGPYNGIQIVVVSDDDNHIVYTYLKNGRWWCSYNNEIELSEQIWWGFEFSKNANYLTFTLNYKKMLWELKTNKTYIGSLYKDGVVYVDGNQIIIEPYEK